MGIFAATSGRVRVGWRVAFFGLAVTAAGLFVSGIVYEAISWTPIIGWARQYVVPLSEYGEALAFVIGTYGTLRIIDGVRDGAWSRIGLGARALGARPMLAGLAAGSLAILVPCAALIAAGRFSFEGQPVDAGSWWSAARGAVFLLLPAAFGEELAVRGYLLTTLNESLGRMWSVAITSVIFAMTHLLNPGPTFLSTSMVALAGVFLATVRLSTGSLWAATVAHLAWNLVQAVVLHAPVSGLPLPTPGYRLVDHGPAWLTGGAWGPEGGLAAAAGMLVATFLVLRLQPRFEPAAHVEPGWDPNWRRKQ